MGHRCTRNEPSRRAQGRRAFAPIDPRRRDHLQNQRRRRIRQDRRPVFRRAGPRSRLPDGQIRQRAGLATVLGRILQGLQTMSRGAQGICKVAKFRKPEGSRRKVQVFRSLGLGPRAAGISNIMSFIHIQGPRRAGHASQPQGAEHTTQHPNHRSRTPDQGPRCWYPAK